MSAFAVVQTRFEKIEPAVLRAALIESGGVLAADAGLQSRRVQGILGEQFTAEQAQQVAAQLAAQGHAVRVLPSESLPRLEKPRPVRWLTLGAEQVEIPWGHHGEMWPVLWSSVFVVSSGQIAKTKERRESVRKPRTSSRQRYPTIEEHVYQRSEYVHVTDLIAIAENGQVLNVRLPAREMAYKRILGPGPVRNSFAKYLELLSVLVERSNEAIIPPSTRKLLVERKERYRTEEGGSRESSDELRFRAFNRWLLQLAILREQARIDDGKTK